MTTIDHQQAAIRAAALVIAPHAYDKALWRCTLADGRSMEQTASDAEITAREALTAAAPHLRAALAEEVRAIDIPEHRLHDQLPSDHWYAGQKAMRDEIVTLLEGGGE